MKYLSAQNLKPLLAALLLALPPAALAAPATPGAGSILQQIQPVTPQPLHDNTGLKIEQPGGATLPPSAPFLVKGIRITGNTLFDAATLHILVADAEGREFTLSELA